MWFMTPTAVCVLVALSGCALGGEYFLSVTGDDQAPGTRQAPWQSLDKANEALMPGDTVTLLEGSYSGGIRPGRSGEAAAPITYRAERPLAARITGDRSGEGTPLCIRLDQRQHIVIDGLLLLPDTGGWMGLYSSSHCIIRNCRMENATGAYSPIECKDCHYNRYENLECRRSNNIGSYGHVAGDMWNNFGCTHNVFEAIHISRAGHRPFGLWFDCPYNVVRRCVFDNRWGRNFEFFSTPRLLVEQCVITNGFDGSGSADGRAKLFIIDSIFRRNVIYRNHYGPMVINAYKYHELPTFGMKRSRLYHNTWYRNHEYGYEMVDLGRSPEPHMVTANIFQNNIFAFNDPGGDGLALYITSNIADDNRFRCNILYGDKPGCKTVRYDWAWPGIEKWPGLAMTADEANAARPDQFAGNMDADPGFADPQADDYRLLVGSPAIDAGVPLALAAGDGAGRELPVDDARPFFDGFGIPGEQGDAIMVGPDKLLATVIKVDIDTNVLTVDRELKWHKGAWVTLAYTGRGPDLGAYELGAGPVQPGPDIPSHLRLETMETATDPVVVTDFEPENLEQWHYYWNFSRQRYTDARMDNTTAASGKHSMRIFATGDGANLSCDIRPRWWDIDRFPTVRLSYRIPPGVPVGVWLHAFKSASHGNGAVCVGGTAAHDWGGYTNLAKCRLVDDDRWHRVTIDARAIREVFGDVKLLQMFRFYTNGRGKKGQQFWFDDFRILSAAEPNG